MKSVHNIEYILFFILRANTNLLFEFGHTKLSSYGSRSLFTHPLWAVLYNRWNGLGRSVFVYKINIFFKSFTFVVFIIQIKA